MGGCGTATELTGAESNGCVCGGEAVTTGSSGAVPEIDDTRPRPGLTSRSVDAELDDSPGGW